MKNKAKSIEIMEESRVVFLCLFERGKLLKEQKMDNYSIDAFNEILACAVEFSMMYYYPKRYIDNLYSQLSEICGIDDCYSDARNATFQETKAKINENTLLDECERSQFVFYIKLMLEAIEKSNTFTDEVKERARTICEEYIGRISSIEHRDDKNNKMKLYQVSRLCSNLRALCICSEKQYIGMWMCIDNLNKSVNKIKKPDSFAFYKYYFKKYGIRGRVGKDNIESKIQELIHYVSNELSILRTHLIEGYLPNHPDEGEEYRSSDEYYKDLQRLIKENPELLLNSSFSDNIAYMMHINDKKKMKAIRKQYNKITKKGE